MRKSEREEVTPFKEPERASYGEIGSHGDDSLCKEFIASFNVNRRDDGARPEGRERDGDARGFEGRGALDVGQLRKSSV